MANMSRDQFRALVSIKDLEYQFEEFLNQNLDFKYWWLSRYFEGDFKQDFSTITKKNKTIWF